MAIKLDISADELAARLLALAPSAKLSLLDSCGRGHGGSHLLIAAINPIESREFYCRTQTEAFAALQFLDEKIKHYADCYRVPETVDFWTYFYESSRISLPHEFRKGACFATFAYEFGMLLENIMPRRKEFAAFDSPSATFSFYDTLIVHEYKRGETFVVGRQAAETAEILTNTIGTQSIVESSGAADFKSNFTKSEYLAAVEKIRAYIVAGDIYQANLTQQITVDLPGDLTAEQIFLRLRANHPAAFAAFVRREPDAVISASPERFLEVGNLGQVKAAPIKGTRRRGATPNEDARLKLELKYSEKDRAENVMIVDLLRNDLGRVCHYGSIAVENLCSVETHPTLFHLVSTVRGQLRNKVTAGALLKAAFPCGSITGAPKIRAIRILDEIETAPRNLSMGAIGYFGFDGSLDLNVAIRTAVIRANKAVFNVGGGIVFDSDPESEYEESWLKAQALLKAMNAGG